MLEFPHFTRSSTSTKFLVQNDKLPFLRRFTTFRTSEGSAIKSWKFALANWQSSFQVQRFGDLQRASWRAPVASHICYRESEQQKKNGGGVQFTQDDPRIPTIQWTFDTETHETNHFITLFSLQLQPGQTHGIRIECHSTQVLIVFL